MSLCCVYACCVSMCKVFVCVHPWSSPILETAAPTQIPFCYPVLVPSLFLRLNRVTICTQGKVIAIAHPGMLALVVSYELPEACVSCPSHTAMYPTLREYQGSVPNSQQLFLALPFGSQAASGTSVPKAVPLPASQCPSLLSPFNPSHLFFLEVSIFASSSFLRSKRRTLCTPPFLSTSGAR